MNTTKYFSFKASDGCELRAVQLVHRGDQPKSTVVLLHGGGPDHHSLMPLAHRIAGERRIILPDVRGYGKSVCYDSSCFTWNNYAHDVIDLLDHLNIRDSVVAGAGIGASISLKVALIYPERVRGLILISPEDIENDQAKKDEIAFFEKYMAQLRENGISAAWESILGGLSPVIGEMVRDAIPRTDARSLLAAASIVYDRAFKNINELKDISVPTLIIPGSDDRHPSSLARSLAQLLVQGTLSSVALSNEIRSITDFANTFAPVINKFLAGLTLLHLQKSTR